MNQFVLGGVRARRWRDDDLLEILDALFVDRKKQTNEKQEIVSMFGFNFVLRRALAAMPCARVGAAQLYSCTFAVAPNALCDT